MTPEQDTRDRTYCRQHCKGFRDTGGLCFADGECDNWRRHQKLLNHYADVVEAVFKAENKVRPEWRERLQQAATLNSAERLHLARSYTLAIAQEILSATPEEELQTLNHEP